jgi:hypothetical protein
VSLRGTKDFICGDCFRFRFHTGVDVASVAHVILSHLLQQATAYHLINPPIKKCSMLLPIADIYPKHKGIAESKFWISTMGGCPFGLFDRLFSADVQAPLNPPNVVRV